MTARETQIARRILDMLHDLDGGQAHELTIHGEIGGLSTASATELTATLLALERLKLVISIKTKFKGVMYSISDAGEAARLQMS